MHMNVPLFLSFMHQVIEMQSNSLMPLSLPFITTFGGILMNFKAIIIINYRIPSLLPLVHDQCQVKNVRNMEIFKIVNMTFNFWHSAVV